MLWPRPSLELWSALRKPSAFTPPPPFSHPALLLVGDFSDRALGPEGWSLNYRNRLLAGRKGSFFMFSLCFGDYLKARGGGQWGWEPGKALLGGGGGRW